MRAMKDSGIPWIVEIPETWNVNMLSSLFDEHKQKNKDLSETNLLSLSYGKIIRKDINTNEGLLPESFDGYNIISDGDIVFRLTDLQNDKRSLRTGLCLEKGIITSAYVTIRARQKLYSPYYHYLVHSYDVCKVFYGMGDGVRQGMNYSDLRKLLLVSPSYSEQQRIAEFLDRKCAEVDEMIALQEQIIEELKAYKQSVITEAVTKGLNPAATMRNSGIEWIGSIPEYWEVCRIKNIATGFSNGTSVTQLADEDSQYAVTRIETISTGKINYDKVGYVPFFEGINKYLLVKGDILISNINSLERVGNSAMYMGEQTLYHGMNLLRVHTNERMFATYLHYYLRSKAFLEQMKSCCNHAINQVSVSSSTLKNLYIVLPNLTEQQAIADYLDEKCADIDSLIQTKQSKIDSLKEYKKSIIYEYVTGKREVE